MPGGDCATRKAGSTPLFGRQICPSDKSHQECHLWVRPAALNMSKKTKGSRAGLSKWQRWLLHPREIRKNRTWTIWSRKHAHAGEEEARGPLGERAGWGRNGPDGDVINTFVGQGKFLYFPMRGLGWSWWAAVYGSRHALSPLVKFSQSYEKNYGQGRVETLHYFGGQSTMFHGHR